MRKADDTPRTLCRNQILLANPANQARGPVRADDVSPYPNLGLLTLATALTEALEREGIDAEVLYFDGSLLGNDLLFDHIERHSARIALLGLSTYTYNYAACLDLARKAKARDARITTVLGNDHFSALYREVMRQRESLVDFGFHGNDVVLGFCRFAVDLLRGRLADDLAVYPGLVWRAPGTPESVRRNPEDPGEFSRLPLVRYGLLDAWLPHGEGYQDQQRSLYRHLREGGYRTTMIDLGRGCLKFGGPRDSNEIPQNACDFCGIIPGSRAILAATSERAWAVLGNAFEQGYNYLFVSADELPSTFWPLLRKMAEAPPDWWLGLHPDDRPRLMCYARADAFRERMQERIAVLVEQLEFDHFFIGLDGFTEISLRAMNKGLAGRSDPCRDLLRFNLLACREIARHGARITAGAVITHLGITPALLEANFQLMSEMVERHAALFVEIDFELLCPIPGSPAFEYLRRPAAALARAAALGLRVDERYLAGVCPKYQERDLFDPEELVQDFIRGCCPDITVELAYEYLARVRELAERHRIVFECSSL